MLDNHDISNILSTYAKLYELHGGNPFKVRATAGAAYNIKKIGEPLASLSEDELSKVQQIGKGLAPKVFEIIQTGSFEDLNDLLEATPKGVIDILKVKGLGPKKVEVLWKEVGITSIPDLLDACRENRLVEVKGFGFKTQAQIISDIEFKFNQEGKFHWAKLKPVVEIINDVFEASEHISQYEVTGDYRRLNDVVEQLDFLVICNDLQLLADELSEHQFELIDVLDDYHLFQYAEAVNVRVFNTSDHNWGNALVKFTSTQAHLDLIKFDTISESFDDEIKVYHALNLPYILPELREGLNELAHLNEQDQLITYTDLKGVMHNHSTYSDGLHSLEEMAKQARSMGLQYFGICDHSQTANYANGLKPERVLEQMREIEALNKKMAPFKILSGIESDILGDGSLDYTDDILMLFDIVVASVHSNLTMDMEKAHLRLKRAIENPYTTILGHPTGRLLLMRPGYPIDHAYIIDACVDNHVAIELNAHPYRLDLDWRWIDYALNKGAYISINPDAHQKEGLSDMQYGVNVARKGYLKPTQCLNALGLDELLQYIERKRKISMP